MRKKINYLIRGLGVELHKYVPVKSPIRHAVDTLAYSLDDDIAPNDFLISLAGNAIQGAWNTKINLANPKELDDSIFFDVYPGEHYRLLKALAIELAPEKVVEIGTYTGMGSLSLCQGLPDTSKVHTFDIVPWNELPTHLNQDLFDSGQLTQYLTDLADPNNFSQYLDLLESADFIFCDGPKDGQFEYKFVSHLTKLKPTERRILMLDDIRFKNMIDLWRSIESPKLDLSSFGHWSGTGLVDISNGLKLKKP